MKPQVIDFKDKGPFSSQEDLEKKTVDMMLEIAYIAKRAGRKAIDTYLFKDPDGTFVASISPTVCQVILLEGEALGEHVFLINLNPMVIRGYTRGPWENRIRLLSLKIVEAQ